MTRDDRVIQRLEEYLDEYEGNTVLPDRVRDAVRAELPNRKQGHPSPGLARFITMSSTLRYGIAAVVIGVAALVGWNIFRNSSVGPPSVTLTPQPTPSGSASSAVIPADLQFTFTGPMADTSAPGTLDTQQVAISAHSLVLNPNGARKYTSDAVPLGSDRFTLTSTTNLQGCEAGDLGTYSWELSPMSSTLTLTAEDDACADRAAALSGTWLRMACADGSGNCPGMLDAGSYMSAYFQARTTDGAFQPRVGRLTYSVPDGWAAYAEWPDGYGLTPASEYAAYDGSDCYDCPGTRDVITVLADPGAMAEDCSDANAPGVGFRAADLVTWISQHPGLVVTDQQQITIDGRAATSLRVAAAADWSGTCDPTTPFVAVPLLYVPDSGAAYALVHDDSVVLIVMDVGADHTVVILIDAANQDDPSAFAEEAMPVVETFAFHP